MSHQLNEHVQEAIERLEIYDLSPEHFSDALPGEIHILAGIEFTNREAELEIQFHTTLRF
jgi:hypothetical protein